MYDLIEVVAKIELFKGNTVRQIPFLSGYRPSFNFTNARTKISGKFDLIDKESFAPGETGVVKITFIKGMIDDTFFTKGVKFTFDEGLKVDLGRGEIMEGVKQEK